MAAATMGPYESADSADSGTRIVFGFALGRVPHSVHNWTGLFGSLDPNSAGFPEKIGLASWVKISPLQASSELLRRRLVKPARAGSCRLSTSQWSEGRTPYCAPLLPVLISGRNGIRYCSQLLATDSPTSDLRRYY